LAVRTFADRYPVTLDGTDGAEFVAWAGEDAVLVRLADGGVRVYDIGAGSSFDLPAGATPLELTPR
jgi:hypothetical protein